MSTRKLIGILLLVLLVIGGFFIFSTLFPSGPVMDNVPNPISDKATHSKSFDDSTIPTNPLKEVYFGDLHVHTSLSFDAYLGGVLTTPDDAYQFAKGKEIHIFGRGTKIDRPLDFTAVTDHSELLGEMYSIKHTNDAAARSFAGRMMRSIHGADNEFNLDTARQRLIFAWVLKQAGQVQRTHPAFFRGYKTTIDAWEIILDAAEKHYEPGKFTTFAGFEWTLSAGRAHLHRNIIFRDMVVPDYPISSLEVRNEEDLWNWLKEITTQGSTVMAIPHNSNLAAGKAFSDEDAKGNPITAEYAQLRQDFEPLIEIHQVKGNSEVHAAFWKNDEFADFENHTFHPALEQNYIRYALKRGLEYKDHFGVNPFKFGLIGSTDTHNGTPGKVGESDSVIGNKGIIDALPWGRRHAAWALDETQKVFEVVNPGGLVAVWAEANTRGHIYDALKSKEVYATSGSRIQVRFFAGNNFEDSLTNYEAIVQDGYDNGIAMGGDMSHESALPEFLIWAKKDPEGANLDRIQVIKGWYADGELHEKIFNVAVADGRVLNPDGTVADNGAQVNRNTGEWDRTKGSDELKVVWKDESFNPAHHAFYYVRVLEIPTASWRLWDQIRYGLQYPDDAELTVRERAWSSPIWYSPEN